MSNGNLDRQLRHLYRVVMQNHYELDSRYDVARTKDGYSESPFNGAGGLLGRMLKLAEELEMLGFDDDVPPPKPCAWCKSPIIGKRADAKCCSRQCRTALNKAAQRAR